MKTHVTAPTGSVAQCFGAAQADAERLHGRGRTPTWRAGAFDWRPWAAAGVALSAVAACAVALLWPWEAPAVAGLDAEAAVAAVAAMKAAVATPPRQAAAAIDASNEARVELPTGPSIASPFGQPMGALSNGLGGALSGASNARLGAPTAAWLSDESDSRNDCVTDCPTASASTFPSDRSARLPTARLIAEVPTDLDAWALDPHPYAVPAVARTVTRPLYNTPAIPDENNAAPGDETSAEPVAVPSQTSAE